MNYQQGIANENNRIMALERKCRRLQYAVVATVGLLTMTMLAGMATRSAEPEHLRAKSLEIVNDRGETVVQLKPSGRESGLIIVSSGQRPGLEGVGVIIGLDGGNSGRVAIGKGTKTHAVLGSSGSAGLVTILNEEGQPLAGLAPTDRGGQLQILDNRGRPVIEGEPNSDGDGALRTFAPSGKALVELHADAEGGMVHVSNRDGDPVAMLAVDVTKHGLFAVSGRPGRQGTVMATVNERGQGSIATTDAGGRVTGNTGARP